MHGENDNDVPIAEAEQFFIALKDVGTEAIFVRYPREGHGLAETGHNIDAIDRSIAWYERHFPKPGEEGRSEERRVGKSVDLGGRRIIKKKKKTMRQVA